MEAAAQRQGKELTTFLEQERISNGIYWDSGGIASGNGIMVVSWGEKPTKNHRKMVVSWGLTNKNHRKMVVSWGLTNKNHRKMVVSRGEKPTKW